MYRTVQTSFWTDPKIRALPTKAKLLFAYLITSPSSHIAGIYYLPLATISYETNLDQKETKEAMSLLVGADVVAYDKDTNTVWVKNMLRHQGRGQKIIRAVEYQLETLHHSKLIKLFLEYYQELKIAYRYPFDTLSKGGAVLSSPSPSSNSSEGEGRGEGDDTENALPSWVDKKTWEEFRKMRQRIRKPMTAHAEELLLKDLAKLKAAGQDATAVVEQSIKHSWQGLFQVRQDDRNLQSKVEEIRRSTRETLSRGITK